MAKQVTCDKVISRHASTIESTVNISNLTNRQRLNNEIG